MYTKNADYIIGNLIADLPDEDIKLIDPFAGEGDLLRAVSAQRRAPTRYMSFDIDPKLAETQHRDTLLDPPDYSGWWVVTNPPYLARNKTNDKRVFDRWGVGDKYKAAIKSVMGCVGGIIVLPLNFLCDERDDQVRVEFLSRYTITNLNIFEERVFDDTDYTVCSFSFVTGGGARIELTPRFYPDRGDSNASRQFHVDRRYRYRFGGELLDWLNSNQSNTKIMRLIKDAPASGYVSNLLIRAIDTGGSDGRISLKRASQPYYGHPGDKTLASFVFEVPLNRRQEDMIADRFNELLNRHREEYHSLFLTNYRTSTKNYARKRISFDLAYKYLSYILKNEWGY